MGFLRNAGKAIGKAWNRIRDVPKRVIQTTVDAYTAPQRAIIEVVRGKPVAQAVKDVIKRQIDPLIVVADAASTLDSLRNNLLVQIAGQVGQEKAADFIADWNRVLAPFPPEDRVAILKGVQLFIQTGNLDALSPLSILVAGEIADARNALVGKGTPIEDAVIAAMPEAVKSIGRKCASLTRREVPGALNLPQFAIKHLQLAQAITLIDVIIFEVVPSATTQGGKHIWAHELWHAHQYDEWGLQKFATKYVAEQTGFHSANKTGVNAVEVEAIAFACRNFLVQNPGYGISCAQALG